MSPNDMQGPRQPPTVASHIWALIDHTGPAELDHDAAVHPEGDVRQRFMSLRYSLSQYVEWRVLRKRHEYNEFVREVKERKINPDAEHVCKRYEKLMLELDKELEWSSRTYERDSRMVMAPTVSPYHMDKVLRYQLHKEGKELLAPNGLDRSFYGFEGEAIPSDLTASRGVEDDIFRHLIIHKLLEPFGTRVLTPIQQFGDKILKRETTEQPQGIRGRTLDIMVNALECLLSVIWFAGSVILVYNQHSMKNRIMASTFSALAFPVCLVFLSREAVRICTLTAGFWAVLVVFMGNAGCISCQK
ncbi:hypothetical protein BCR34DRAFT_595422 [Clohesyomyces aquaticus]|uniref:DUF6594 domain-containing protein n=1 Tax=Clohesyomyces aquaticus TaxID=1231657 RepID=A0A1Y2AAB2_9PLEO|nr:hypothetical protein BCR34DRAFT_595422 [Clohesyomyces aquaticus]